MRHRTPASRRGQGKPGGLGAEPLLSAQQPPTDIAEEPILFPLIFPLVDTLKGLTTGINDALV